MKIFQLTSLFLLLLLPSISISQILKIEYDTYSEDRQVKRGNATLYLTQDRAQFVRDFKGQTVEVDEVTIVQQPDEYIYDIYPKEGMVDEFRFFKDQLFTSEWEFDKDWVITEETDEILGFIVRKAYSPKDPIFGRTIVWFTMDIPFPAGPSRYVGLPGLILKIAYEEDEMEIIASKITEIDSYDFIEHSIEKAIPLEREEIKWFEERTLKKKIRQNK